MNHVVMFSGGVGSYVAAKRVAERHGTESLALLFTDTNMEDEDLYRFVEQAALDVGAPLVRLDNDGKTPWDVFFEKRFLGNTRVDPCSKILKRDRADEWLAAHYTPDTVTVYVGIDWSEEHRFTPLRERKLPWKWEAPLCEPPYLTRTEMFAQLERAGIEVPRLYRMGFAHNNCGGFCIKAGQGHFKILLEQMPERYAYHEQKEQEIREYLGKDVAILRDRTGGKTRPLTLKEFRERLQGGEQCDIFDIGGCDCFSGTAEAA